MGNLNPFLYILLGINALLFFYGFFPISLPKRAQSNEPPNSINNLKLNRDIYNSNISKTVLFVIDALRLDFVNSQYMPLVSKITQETGCFNQVKVHLPTVTLPRIKALISGFLPQFIDIALNLASTDTLQDSLIHSFIKNKKKVVFYGDDTWLKLFPSQFTRSEGVHSFFVRDFTEVDDNVTRNVDYEIEKDDWDIMILHYLGKNQGFTDLFHKAYQTTVSGLDHIGHVYGPFSSLVPRKLLELDFIVSRIFTILSEKYSNHLVILTGDHGMKDSGGHGGSTFAETNVPFLIMGLHCQNASLEQTDIPVNLASLHGVDIPSTSLGRIKKNLLPFSLDKYLYVLYYNLKGLSNKSNICANEFEAAQQSHVKFLMHNQDTFGIQAAEIYENCTNKIVENLSKSAVEQNISLLKITIGFMAVPLIVLFLKISSEFCNYVKFQSNSFLSLIFLNVLQPLTLFSTSYIEEEHQYWYFAIGFAFIIICMSTFKTSELKNILYCLSLSALFRFLRNMNSTGDQWAHLPDISDWLINEQNHLYYDLFFLFSLMFLFVILWNICNSYPEKLLNLTVLTLVYIFKTSSSISLCRIIWLLVIVHFVLFNKTSKITTWCLIAALLLKPYNVILIPFCLLTSLLFRTKLNHFSIIICHIWLGNMLYFAQGHSNSLASVDVSVGYMGLHQYNLFIVIVQVLCHTYMFPIMCHLLAFQASKQHSHSDNLFWDIIFLNRFYVMFIVCFVSYLNREHLFIWSVFAPKLFIETIHVCVLFIEYLIYRLYNLRC